MFLWSCVQEVLCCRTIKSLKPVIIEDKNGSLSPDDVKTVNEAPVFVSVLYIFVNSESNAFCHDVFGSNNELELIPYLLFIRTLLLNLIFVGRLKTLNNLYITSSHVF
jgi:hypothetical protein